MHARTSLALACALLSAAACTSVPESDRHGAPLRLSGAALPVSLLLAEPERFDGQTIACQGRVAEVCPKKGCWMTLRDGERELRVTFQDYAFFVPLDAAGATMRAEGLFRIVETPADELRHYLEDAGREAEAAAVTGPVRSYTLVAPGVELRRP
jgi:hypothetical protein